MKDQASALNLLEEIETAKLYHPIARQSISFISRIDTVMKRLAVRGDPASSTSMFPRPEQHLFPDQKDANENLVECLSGHIATANKLARKVDQAAKEYRNTYEAVKRAETILHTISNVSTTLTTINTKFRDGLHIIDGDGTPPNLSTERCLDPASHSIFLSHLPSLLDDATEAMDNADKCLRIAPSSILGLEIPGIDAGFKKNVASEVQKLSTLRDETSNLRLSIASQAENLRECRKISSAIDSRLNSLKILNLQVSASIDRDKWRQEGNLVVSCTPENSMSSLLPPSLTNSEFEEQLTSLSSRLIADVVDPLEWLSTTMEPFLPAILKGKLLLLQQSIDSTSQLIQLLYDVRRQSSAMNTVRKEFHEIAVQIEDSKIQFINVIDKMTNDLGGTASDSVNFPVNQQAIQQDVTAFIERLSKDIPFVARHSIPVAIQSPSLTAPPILGEFTGELPELDAFPALHIDLSAVDAAIRADSNSFVMRLNGGVETLTNLESHMELAVLAKTVDSNLISISADLDALAKELAVQKGDFSSVVRENTETISQLHVVLLATQAMRSKSSKVARSLSPINDSLRGMEEKSKIMEPSIRGTLYDSRAMAVRTAETRLSDWLQEVDSFNEEICLALNLEHEYQENVKAAKERRLLEEQERLASEEMENILLEQKRAENDKLQLLLEVKLAEDRQRELDRQHKVFEAAEEQRLAAAKAEQERLEELEKQARLASEEAERVRLDQQEILEKLRIADTELQEQRRLRSECEAAGVELSKEQLVENRSRRGGETEGSMATNSGNDGISTMPSLSVPPTDEAVFTSPRNSNIDVDDAGELFVFFSPALFSFLKLFLPSDVFGVQGTPYQPRTAPFQQSTALHVQIMALRKRLRSICINETLRPSKSPSTSLPTSGQLKGMSESLTSILTSFNRLHTFTDDRNLMAELKSLNIEIDDSFVSLKEIQKLVDMCEAVQSCDSALSDLLEHVDSYPAAPLILTSSHKSVPTMQPEEQLSARLRFTGDIVQNMQVKFTRVLKDCRAISERTRIQQTWDELQEMANDRIGGKKSRPGSVISRNSSGRSSSASAQPAPLLQSRGAKKRGSYSNLSVSSASGPSTAPSKGKMLAPPHPQYATRRVVSGSSGAASRSTRSSVSTARSVSGPLSASIYGSTFASRQRTNSLSNPMPTLSRQPTVTPSRFRNASENKRPTSPTVSDSHTPSSFAPSRSTGNSSTWARAPRESFSGLHSRITSPIRKVTPVVRKKYVADPKSKLDMAVGDVVNQLPVGINIEGITETWRDQSGKYWIGNQDPKLCFCRILRSQTVMVRVGGGWTELSKYVIRDG